MSEHSKSEFHKNEFEKFDINVVELSNYLYSHIYFVIIGSIAAASIVGLYSFFFKEPMFLSQATITLEDDQSDALNGAQAQWAYGSDTESKVYKATMFFKSAQFRDGIVAEVDGQTQYSHRLSGFEKDLLVIKSFFAMKGAKTREQKAALIRTLISYGTDTNRGLILVKGVSFNSDLSKAVSNIAAVVFAEMAHQNSLDEMNSIVSFIEEQTGNTEARLKSLEGKLAEIQRNEKIMSESQISSDVDRSYQSESERIRQLKVEVARNKLLTSQIEFAISGFRKNLARQGNSHLYLRQLQKQIDLLRYRKSVESPRQPASAELGQIDHQLQQVTENFNTRFKEIQGQWLSTDPWRYLSELESSLLKTKQETSAAEARLVAHQEHLDSQSRIFERLPNIIKKIAHLRRNIDITADLYGQLKSRLQEMKIKRIGKSREMRVLIYASRSDQPIGMSAWKKMVASLIIGAFLVIGLLGARYILIPTIRNRKDLTKVGTSVLGEIPYVRIQSTELQKFGSHPLLIKLLPLSEGANALRQARFNLEKQMQLQQRRLEGECTVVSVTSSQSAEGKSFISSNIAYSLGVAQFRVLLIDLDLLKPDIRNYFALPEVQRAEGAEGDIQFERTAVTDFLDVVGIYKSRGVMSDILETPILGDYINSMRSNYDVILIDTPPVRNSLEPLIAARQSDGIIFIANQRGSLRDDVQKYVSVVQNSFDGPVMSVLNFSYDELNATKRRVA